MNQALAQRWDRLKFWKGLRNHKVATEGWCCHREKGIEIDEGEAVTRTVRAEGGRRGWVSVGGVELRSYSIGLCGEACHCTVVGGRRRSGR